MVLVCRGCGTENREGVKFRKGCGSAIAANESKSMVDGGASDRQCPNCGTSNSLALRFCRVCTSRTSSVVYCAAALTIPYISPKAAGQSR
jgi:hypothetical protein